MNVMTIGCSVLVVCVQYERKIVTCQNTWFDGYIDMRYTA